MKGKLFESMISDARAIGEIILAAITLQALSEASIKLVEAGLYLGAAIAVLLPAIVLLRATERTLEMWRKYRPHLKRK